MLSLSGSATAGRDFTFTDAGGRTFTNPFLLKLPSGQSSVTGVITAVNDSRDEGDETISVEATYAGATIGSAVTVTASDDDAAPGPELESLAVTTPSSRSLYPSFDPGVLHYAVGCESVDHVLQLSLSAKDAAVRLAVDSIQSASRDATVRRSGLHAESDIVISLSDGSGQHRTYTVHCLDDDFPQVRVERQPRAWDGLLMGTYGPGRNASWAYLWMMDNNGVPWLRQRLPSSHGSQFQLSWERYVSVRVRRPGHYHRSSRAVAGRASATCGQGDDG